MKKRLGCVDERRGSRVVGSVKPEYLWMGREYGCWCMIWLGGYRLGVTEDRDRELRSRNRVDQLDII